MAYLAVVRADAGRLPRRYPPPSRRPSAGFDVLTKANRFALIYLSMLSIVRNS